MSELPDFLGGEPTSEPAPEAAAPAAAPETPAVAEAHPAEGQARGPDGKFAAPTPPAEAAPAAPVTDAQGHIVPLATFLDIRDKLTAAEKEARELRDWRTQQEAQRQRQATIPDRATDPEGHAAYVEAVNRQAFTDLEMQSRRDMSRLRAEVKHGEETVNAAYTWAAQRIDDELSKGVSPLNEALKRSADPISVVLEEYRKDRVVSAVSDPSEYEAFLAWKATQTGGAAPPAPTPAPSAPPQPLAAPRSSLAAGPSAGASADAVPPDGEATFSRMFG